MIVAMENGGLNDVRPFMLTWEYKDRNFSLDIEKNITRDDLENGWTVEKRGIKFLVKLTPMQADDPTKDDGNGEHRYWKLAITDVTEETPAPLANGTVSWGEFFVLDGLYEHDMVITDQGLNG
jgi:hypothetical protein